MPEFLLCFVQQPWALRPWPSEQYQFQFYCFEYSSVIWSTPAENYHRNNNSTIIRQCKDTPENQLQQRSMKRQFSFLFFFFFSLVTGTADEIMRLKTFARFLRENKINFSWTIKITKEILRSWRPWFCMSVQCSALVKGNTLCHDYRKPNQVALSSMSLLSHKESISKIVSNNLTALYGEWSG